MNKIMIVGAIGTVGFELAATVAKIHAQGIETEIISPEKAEELGIRPPVKSIPIMPLPELVSNPPWDGSTTNRAGRRKEARLNKKKR